MNANKENINQVYKKYYGEKEDTFVKMKKEEFKILSINDLISKRIEVATDPDKKNMINYWWDNFYTATGLLIDLKNKNTKLVPNLANEINYSEVKIVFDYEGIFDTKYYKIIAFNRKEYESFKGKEFSIAEIEELKKEYISTNEIPKHPFWLAASNYDNTILSKFADLNLKLSKNKDLTQRRDYTGFSIYCPEKPPRFITKFKDYEQTIKSSTTDFKRITDKEDIILTQFLGLEGVYRQSEICSIFGSNPEGEIIGSKELKPNQDNYIDNTNKYQKNNNPPPLVFF
ncbi:MAG: hypothetical protein ACP5N1_06015 [Candidatus Woesearchaeota archaeon]